MQRKVRRCQAKQFIRRSAREAKKRTWNGSNLPGPLPWLRFVGRISERIGGDLCEPGFSRSGEPFEPDKVDRIVWHLQRRDGHGDHYWRNRSFGWVNVRFARRHSRLPSRTG